MDQPVLAMGEMAASAALLLKGVAARLPLTLVTREARAAILAAAEWLPPSSGIGFEARLVGDPARVDFFVRLKKADASAGILAGAHPRYRLPAAMANDPLWQRMMRLARHCGDGAASGPWIDQLWLEIDKADLSGRYPRCSIAFLDVLSDAEQMPDALAGGLLDVFLPLALEGDLDRPQRDCIRAALAAGRPFGALKSIGCSLTRPEPAIRLVHNTTRPRLAEFLAALGLGDRAADIVRVMQSIPAREVVGVNVDAGLQLGPRIGVELAADTLAGWRGMFAALVGLGLCTPDRGEVLTHWPGVAAELAGTSPDRFVHRVPDQPARLRDGLAVRKINHVKVSFTPDGAVEAKVYLFAGFVWPAL